MSEIGDEGASGVGEGLSSVPYASEAATPVPLRVATWNLNHWRQPLLPVNTRRGAWQHLADPMGAQVALVQEAVPPTDLPRERQVYGELAGYRAWGSGVVALDPTVVIEPIRSVRMPWNRRRYLLDQANPGSVAVARVMVAGLQPITFVSVYGVLEGAALMSIHRVVADLLPLFDSPDGARVILGGDFNVTQSSADVRYLARANTLLEACGRSAWSRRRRLSRGRRAGTRSARAAGRPRVGTSEPGRTRSSTTSTSRRRSPPR